MPDIEISTSLKTLLKESHSITQSSDGKTLVAVMLDSSICFWDVKRQEKEAIFQLDILKKTWDGASTMISNDNHLLVATIINRHTETIALYNVKSSTNGKKTLMCIQKIKRNPNESLISVEIIPHTNLIAILGSNAQTDRSDLSAIQFFNSKTNKYTRSFTIPRCYFIKFFDEATMITIGGNWDCIKLWDLKSKSEQPIHTLVTKDKIKSAWNISDKQLMTQEGEFINIYNINPFELITSTHIGKYLMDSRVILNSNNMFAFHNLDNKNFISTHYYKNPDRLELNLWRLSNNGFKMLSPEGFPMKIELKTKDFLGKPIKFIPFQKNEGSWLCVIKDQNGVMITPVHNKELAPVPDNNESRTFSI